MPFIEEKQLKKYEKYFNIFPKRKVALSLERIKRLLEFFQHPEKKLKGVHVGGTNGKGSTCAMLQAVLTQAGYRVGLFTSPHLVSWCERFRIGYQRISLSELIRYLERVKQATTKIKGEKPTWFEALTAVAILYFLDQKVEVAIFEVGLGGRGDATNILDLGIEVITSISFDHQKILGNSLAKITKEKREIIKKNSTVITGASGKILELIKEKAKQCAAIFVWANEEVKVKLKKIDFDKMRVDLKSSFWQLKNLEMNLVGVHQLENLKLVVATLEVLRKKGLAINSHHIREGLAKIDWPGRFQLIRKNPLIVFDGAHNPGGMKVLVQTCKALTKKKWVVIFAAKQGKDYQRMLKILQPIVSQIFFPYLVDKTIKFYSPYTLKKFFPQGKISSSLREASVKAIKWARKEKLPLLFCGSIYFLGKILHSLDSNFQFAYDKKRPPQ